MIEITNKAQEHLAKLVAKKKLPHLLLEILNAGTINSECRLQFYNAKTDKNAIDKIALEFHEFILYIAADNINFAKGIKIDLVSDDITKQEIIIDCSNSNLSNDTEWSMKEKVQYIIDNEINPMLANHGGMVSVAEIDAENIVYLRFGGGCQGCSMIDITLKQGIHNILHENIAGIKEIRDVTDHDQGKNPYS